MELSRRSFLKAAGAVFATSMAYEFMSPSPVLAVESSSEWKLVNTEEYTNICCYCAGGCGSLCSVRDGELINVEGDPDHPINQGGLCRHERDRKKPEASIHPACSSSWFKRMGAYQLARCYC